MAGTRHNDGSGHVTLTCRPKKDRVVGKDGYARVLVPGHPKASNSGYVYEHIVVAERALGHLLPPLAEVHHVNEVRDDNRPRNLVICQDKAYHKLLHARARRLRELGSVLLRRCPDCDTTKPLDAFPKNRTNWDGRHHYCKPCSSVRSRKVRNA